MCIRDSASTALSVAPGEAWRDEERGDCDPHDSQCHHGGGPGRDEATPTTASASSNHNRPLHPPAMERDSTSGMLTDSKQGNAGRHTGHPSPVAPTSGAED
eukprot:4536505-Prorocentrum_lima.AAC.1